MYRVCIVYVSYMYRICIVYLSCLYRSLLLTYCCPMAFRWLSDCCERAVDAGLIGSLNLPILKKSNVFYGKNEEIYNLFLRKGIFYIQVLLYFCGVYYSMP